jgi:hypothetical protein
VEKGLVMAKQAEECVKCGTGLTRPATGRPPRYCSVTCRRAAEFELRRVQRRLESLEREEQELRAGRHFWLSGEHMRERLDFVRAEIDRLEARMRELFDAGAEPRP